MAMLSHFISFLGEVNRREEVDTPELAICIRASAQRRSIKMYSRPVEMENTEEGMSANNGSSKGAYMAEVSDSSTEKDLVGLSLRVLYLVEYAAIVGRKAMSV